MDNFTPSDSDLVFRRKERWIMVGVLAFDTLLFGGIFFSVLKDKPGEAWIAGGVMVLALVMLAVISAWMWTFELRLTPYEVVVRSCFGTKVVSYSNIAALKRERIKGKTPAQYQMRLSTSENAKLVIPAITEGDRSAFDEIRIRARNAKVEDVLA